MFVFVRVDPSDWLVETALRYHPSNDTVIVLVIADTPNIPEHLVQDHLKIQMNHVNAPRMAHRTDRNPDQHDQDAAQAGHRYGHAARIEPAPVPPHAHLSPNLTMAPIPFDIG